MPCTPRLSSSRRPLLNPRACCCSPSRGFIQRGWRIPAATSATIFANTSMGAFGEVLACYDKYVDIDPVVRDKWGIPALRFHYKFGDNEHRMAEDMKETSQEMFEAAGFEIVRVSSRVLTEGWSIHEL